MKITVATMALLLVAGSAHAGSTKAAKEVVDGLTHQQWLKKFDAAAIASKDARLLAPAEKFVDQDALDRTSLQDFLKRMGKATDQHKMTIKYPQVSDDLKTIELREGDSITNYFKTKDGHWIMAKGQRRGGLASDYQETKDLFEVTEGQPRIAKVTINAISKNVGNVGSAVEVPATVHEGYIGELKATFITPGHPEIEGRPQFKVIGTKANSVNLMAPGPIVDAVTEHDGDKVFVTLRYEHKLTAKDVEIREQKYEIAKGSDGLEGTRIGKSSLFETTAPGTKPVSNTRSSIAGGAVGVH